MENRPASDLEAEASANRSGGPRIEYNEPSGRNYARSNGHRTGNGIDGGERIDRPDYSARTSDDDGSGVSSSASYHINSCSSEGSLSSSEDSSSDRASDGGSDDESRGSSSDGSSRDGRGTDVGEDLPAAPLTAFSTNCPSSDGAHRRAIRPTSSRGLAPQDDQNLNPNADSTLVRRRVKSSSRQEGLPQCRKHGGDRCQGGDERGSSRSGGRRRRGDRRRDRSGRARGGRREPSSLDLLLKYACCRSGKLSTQFLVASFALWIVAQICYFRKYDLRNLIVESAEGLYGDFLEAGAPIRRGGRGLSGREKKTLARHRREVHSGDHFETYRRPTPEEMFALRQRRAEEAREALGTAAGGDNDDASGRPRRDTGGKPRKDKVNSRRDKSRRKKGSHDSEGGSRVERLREGCSALDWHGYHFPNCNEVHEVDLRGIVRDRRRSRRGRTGSHDSAVAPSPWGFVGAGHWRDVFTCDPRGEAAYGDPKKSAPVPPAVLKMMKSEHPYNTRNFHRHRRDALVMERLSSSHHLVPIFGYCANTVLTGAISHTLDDVIYARENERVKKWSPDGGYKTKPPLESWMGMNDDGELLATRETELGRIRLALGVFRGLVDLHEGGGMGKEAEWLPVVHADIQAKQYLVDSHTGKVYLNDFNRCRFMTKKDPLSVNSTGSMVDNNHTGTALESCPLYIPTAPGAARSPEEYDQSALSEKLDVYSAGNVLYGIITGKKPWGGERGKHVKLAIQAGKRPTVNNTMREAVGTVDAELIRLLDRVYEADPKERASAREIVDELDALLERELRRRTEEDEENENFEGQKEKI